MSNSRLKIFSFNSTKITAAEMEREVNEFLSNPNILVESQEIVVSADEFTVITIVYKIKKKPQLNRKITKKRK